jgi:hypothetical protein
MEEYWRMQRLFIVKLVDPIQRGNNTQSARLYILAPHRLPRHTHKPLRTVPCIAPRVENATALPGAGNT